MAKILMSKLYVDDLTLAASGFPQTVIKVIAAAVDFAVEYLEVGLGMEVSAKKSKVLGSKESIVQAILEATSSLRVSAARHCKLLGTDTVGGGRRSTVTFRQRLRTFGNTVHRYKALRRAGANSRQMVRTAGNPAVLYGCETMGIANTALETTRSQFARAAAPDTGGKNPILTLLAIDGESGTLDPAFEAHASPIHHWALAIWEEWFPAQAMCLVFHAAAKKAHDAADHLWAAVGGPTMALHATVQRLGWSLPSPYTLASDLGIIWDFRRDSPRAIKTAVVDGVRRWRWRQAAELLPGLVPTRTDNGSGAPSDTDIIMGMGFGLDRLMRGKQCPKIAGAVSELWQAKFAGDLGSAVSGGQWSQVKKAGIPAFSVQDKRCQLCFDATGTLAHRFECSKTRPTSGWPEPPKEAAKALLAIGDKRRELLKQRGLLVLRLQPSLQPTEGEFRWLADPHNHPECGSATWYFDGSMLLGKWKPLRCTGFGTAVVTPTGTLLGYGLGWPPSWCTTAAAAEAWALGVVLTQCPFPPQMRTDCMALLHTAKLGTAKAVHHSRPLARVWKIIADALEVDIATLIDGNLLAWFPAHKTLSAVGEVKGSNGSRFSIVDWRANRLVDILAKRATEALQPTKHTKELVTSAGAATAHAAALLGVVTNAANNYTETLVDEHGTERIRTLRDSTDRPKTQRAASTPPPSAKTAAKAVVPPLAPRPVAKAWRPLSAAASARAEVAANLKRRVGEIGDSLRASDVDSGKARLALVRERLRQRLKEQR